jgi:hypothetical protein
VFIDGAAPRGDGFEVTVLAMKRRSVTLKVSPLIGGPAMEALETKEKIEETIEGHEGHFSRLRIGLLIAGLAALLALMETGGKSAQTEAVNANLQASNLWAFFQAKTARMTTIRTAAESASLTLLNDLPPETKAAIQTQIDTWNATAARYESEPQTKEGRKELTERALEAEAERDHKLAAYHLFELGSAASQLAIVLASAAIITGVTFLVYLAGGLGIVGAGLGVIAWLAPTMLHL